MKIKDADEDTKQVGRYASGAVSTVGLAVLAWYGWNSAQVQLNTPAEDYAYKAPLASMGVVVYVVGLTMGRILVSLQPAGWTRIRLGLFFVALGLAAGAMALSLTASVNPIYYLGGFLSLLALPVQDFFTGRLEPKKEQVKRPPRDTASGLRG